MIRSQSQRVMLHAMGESVKCASLRTTALDGIQALLDAIGTVADGSDEPGDIVDDDLRIAFMDDLYAILEVRNNIEFPVCNKDIDADFQDAVGELSGSPREMSRIFATFPNLDIARFERGMMALDEFIYMDVDEDDDGDEDESY